MDIEAGFENIRNNIKDGKYDMVLPEVRLIVENSDDDVNTLIKCASLLKVVEEEAAFQEILDSVMKILPENEKERFDVSVAMRGLGRYDDAYSIMRSLKELVPDPYDTAMTYFCIEEYESALEILLKVDDPDVRTSILLTEVYCSLGEFSKADAVADSLIEKAGPTYDVLVNKCSVMFKRGESKEAIKFAKSFLKEDKKNIDNLALNAYVMRINGRTPAAVNYCNRVLNTDFKHIGALETLALCFIEKKSFVNAKLLAGAINDADPGNPAVIRILDACRLLSS